MKTKNPKKNSTKNFLIPALLLCTALTHTACGTDTAGEPGQSQMKDEISNSQENQEVQQPEDSTENNSESSIQPDENNNPGSDTDSTKADAAGPEHDTTVTPVNSNINVDMRRESEDKSADDGTIYFTRSYTYPAITIDGNPEAADKINADIRSKIDSFNADTETETWAKTDYDEMTGDPENQGYSFNGYNESLTFDTARADSNVIAFTMTYSSYTGGAHGNYFTEGVNYNAKTGDLIAFSDLSEDAAAFHEDTLAYNQQLAETEYYQAQMFPPDSDLGGALESTLYADNVWYLSTVGLVFMSQPYALGPYASGTIEFVIPYKDLADMGFNQSYAYTGRTIRQIHEKEACHADLNGDGQEDSIFFYTDYAESDGDTPSYETVFCLSINDIDLAKALADAIDGLADTYYEGQLGLYDLNVEDQYLDLVLVTNVWVNETNMCYSHFFRYTEDGGLIYLGRTIGDVNDPAAEVSWEKN